MPSHQSVLKELIAQDVSTKDLKFVAGVLDHPEAVDLVKQKFEGDRQRKLLVAAGLVAAAAGAFIGDASTIASLHGAFAHVADEGVVASLSAGTLVCGVLSPVYYFKSRAVDNTSLLIQRELGRRRR